MCCMRLRDTHSLYYANILHIHRVFSMGNNCISSSEVNMNRPKVPKPWGYASFWDKVPVAVYQGIYPFADIHEIQE